MKYLIFISLLFCLIFKSSAQLFTGGISSGYASLGLSDYGNHYSGGYSDGYASTVKSNMDFFYLGGIGDGYEIKSKINILGYARGGIGDGFDFASFKEFFIWSGEIGTGWNVTGNWEGEKVPTFTNKVKIPSSPIGSRFPAVNSGNLIIGDSGGDFQAASILIESGAQMITRPNCFIINRSKITIVGTFMFRNPAPNAVSNEGLILIKNGGVMRSDY